MTFEIGGVVGSGGLGFYKQRLFRNSDVATCRGAIVLGTAALVLFAWTAAWGMAANIFFMTLAGAGNCVIDAILSGTLAIGLAEMKCPTATSQVTGFINGIGSFGAILEGILVGFIADQLGWGAVLYTMIIMSGLALVVLLRVRAHLGDSL